MVKHQAWATTIVAPKLVGSMTTKGQMKPTCSLGWTVSQAGENSQSNVPEHTIVSSILIDLIFRRNLRRRTAHHCWGPSLNLLSNRTQATCFKIQNQHNAIINFKINFQSWKLRIKTKQLSQSISPSIKNLCWKVHKSNCIKFENWKHINTNETAYKLIQSWTKQHHSKTSIKISKKIGYCCMLVDIWFAVLSCLPVAHYWTHPGRID